MLDILAKISDNRGMLINKDKQKMMITKKDANEYITKRDAKIREERGNSSLSDNLKYIKYLEKLGVPYEKLIVPAAPHSAKAIYEKNGLDLMRFHDRNFGP